MLTMTPLDEQALKIFWDKRKREAGKLAVDSPLKPKAKPRLGKAQFNWYPTRDLQFSWPTALFSWGVIIVAVLSVSATFIFKDAYSPGPLSSPHFRKDFSINPAIAKNPNNSTCTTCHAAQAPMNKNCANCHTTAAFNSDVSEIHMKVGLTCVDCHSEHHGRDFRPRTVANVACANCHRDGSDRKALNGQPLKTPHGGVTGYPVIDGIWKWSGVTQADWRRRDLDALGTPAQYSLKEQFHLIHVAGRQKGRANCTDCHKAGFEGAAVTQGVRESCVACHGATDAAAAAQTVAARRGFADRVMNGLGVARTNDPQCVSCHAQHGEEKNLRASLRRMER
jgi:hypothetical protein